MLDYLYPEEERRFFTDREYHLALIGMSHDMLAQGLRQHLALAGLRRIGKTVILKEFLWRQLDRAPGAGQHAASPPASDPPSSGSSAAAAPPSGPVAIAYLDLQRLAKTPERFAVQYIGQILAWLGGPPPGPLDPPADAARQIAAVGAYGSAELTEYLLAFHDEAQKERPDQHRLVELAFNWPEVWARVLDRHVLVLIDEFPEVLALDNYPQIRDVVGLFRSVIQTQSRVGYVAAGSMLGLMERIFLGHTSPLFVHFKLITVGPLDREASVTLASRRLAALLPSSAGAIPPDALAEIFRVTGGHPFHVYAVVMRLAEMAVLTGQPLDASAVRTAFTLETLSPTGRIYSLCQYVLDEALQRARGETIPQAVMQVLAGSETGLSLTQVARLLKRPTGAVRQVLHWLCEVDLVVQHEDKTYAFRDPVLHIWAGYFYAGIELSGLPRQQVLEALVSDLINRYQRVTTELGLAKESQVREIVMRFAGQTIDGALLGVSGELRLPTFRQVAPFRSPDGQIEIDALAENRAENGVRWALEIKWRQKAAGLTEVRNLLRKAMTVDAQPWLISRSGFTPQALALARKSGVMVSTREDIETLAAILQ
jgi:hypothetical protein